jgi:hypothetical protein
MMIDEDPLSVTQTWPMSRINTNFAAQTIKAGSSTRLFDALQNARDYINETSQMTDLHTQHTRSLISNLYDELEKRKVRSIPSARQSKRNLGVIREDATLSQSKLREEPHFESMIFSDVGRRLSLRRSSMDAEMAGCTREMDEEIDLSDVYSDLDPVSS